MSGINKEHQLLAQQDAQKKQQLSSKGKGKALAQQKADEEGEPGSPSDVRSVSPILLGDQTRIITNSDNESDDDEGPKDPSLLNMDTDDIIAYV